MQARLAEPTAGPIERSCLACVAPVASNNRSTPVSPRLQWARDGAHWPLHGHSSFVSAAGLQWHVQRMGTGPRVLLLHGTGAASHTWRALAPLLAPQAHLLLLDLPGHGFSDPLPPARCTLPGMAAALSALLSELQFAPDVVVGHSAGAALMLRLALSEGWTSQRRLVSVNGALMPFEGFAGWVYAPLARLMSSSTWVPQLVAWRGSKAAAVERLIGSTGSQLDPAGVALYQQLMGSPAHVAGALAMMAQWDLAPLLHDLPALACPLLLLAGALDTAVRPAQAQRVALRVSHARVKVWAGLGHLAHEEAPGRLFDTVLQELRHLPTDARENGALR
jgi:magnesium chelatase accessory protein